MRESNIAGLQVARGAVQIATHVCWWLVQGVVRAWKNNAKWQTKTLVVVEQSRER